MKKVLTILLIVALLAVFCFSGYQVVSYIIGSRQSAGQFDELSQIVDQNREETRPTAPDDSQSTAPEATEGPATPTVPREIASYAEVYALNNHTVGWIQIEGTKINYPVMQTPEEDDYYLKRDFNRQYSDWGCIYVREECDVNKPSDNVTIYGHNMSDGSMFAGLHKFIEKDYYEEHKLIYFDTLTEYHVYEIFAVFATTASIDEGFRYHMMVDAANEAEFDEFIAQCRELAYFDTGIVPTYGDKIICLSTCEYTHENGRLVVAARRLY